MDIYKNNNKECLVYSYNNNTMYICSFVNNKNH